MSKEVPVTKIIPLADQYAVAKHILDGAELEVKRLRALILAAHPGEAGEFTEEGNDFNVVASFSPRITIVADLVRALLKPKQLAKVTKHDTVQSLRVKPRLRVAA